MPDADHKHEAERQPPPVRTDSPLPPAPPSIEADVNNDEVTVTFGNRQYRVRGWTKNLSFDQLRINLMAHNPTGLFVDTFDLYSAKHRRAFVSQAAQELEVQEPELKYLPTESSDSQTELPSTGA